MGTVIDIVSTDDEQSLLQEELCDSSLDGHRAPHRDNGGVTDGSQRDVGYTEAGLSLERCRFPLFRGGILKNSRI